MPSKISVLLVNLNNLSYTKRCLEDLLNQNVVFNLRLVDQNSSESGTKEFFDIFFTRHSNGEFLGKIDYLEISNTGFNKPLNHLWNDYVKESSTEFICLLNNDVRIPPNFLSSSISVLEKEPSVGFVNHVTNNSAYSSWSDSLEYVIMETPYRQGWDLIFRKSCYIPIPDDLKFFYGDDYIYSKLYSSGYKGAYVLNSPIIHFERSTTTEKGGVRDCSPDGDFFSSLDLDYKNLTFNEELCKWKPEFSFIKMKNLPLHDIGLKNNTDKATHHNFLNFYESKIGHLKNEKINLLEIGFLRGNSIKMWLEYFVNANIYCIDIIDIDFIHERFHYTKISQEDKELKLLFNDNFFDIIVDDGSHITSHQLKSLEYLWGKLKYKGFYILEDLHTSFRSDYIDTDVTPYQILSREKMIDELKNAVSEMTNIEIFNKDPNSNWDSVTSVIKKCEKIKIFDFCIFNNEFEILDIRLEYMSKFIDKFYVCEIDITHQSTKSEFYSYDFIEKSNIAKRLIDDERLEFVRLSLDPSDEYFAVEKNHRIKFSEWVRENVKGEFIGILSDCDEIVSEDIKNYVSDIKTVTRLDLKMFYFTADNYSYLHPWNYFVKAFNSSDLKNYDFQTIREMNIDNIIHNIGWHFSCFGGINQVIDKIKSYSHTEYNNSNNTKRDIITNRIIDRKDYLGRDEYPCIKYNIENYPEDLMKFLKEKEHLLYIEGLLNKENIEICNNVIYMEHFYKKLGENWFTYPNLYSYVVNKFPTNSHFIEVGVWKGMSASYMAVEIINSGKDIKFDCVDNWEFIENLQSDIYQESFSENIYEIFLKNINPVKHIITPIRELSWEGAKHYKDSSLDFVFIDAAHDYESVKKDINAWFPKIKKGGMIAGHDYSWSDDVKKAVNEFFDGEEVYETEGCWVYFTDVPLSEINFWKNCIKIN